MPELLSPPPETMESWESILRLPVEARFAKAGGVEPICSFIWDREPQLMNIDGCIIAVHQLGPEDGTPVLSFHGNPGSARGPHPTSALLEAENIRLIAFDAPGFGESEYALTDTPFAFAGDMAKGIVQSLGYEKVAVMARSGGVPRALGFAALHPEYVSSMVLVAGPAPGIADIDWQAGMTASNQQIYTQAREMQGITPPQLRELIQGLWRAEHHLIESLWPDMSSYDTLLFELQPDLFVSTAAGHAAGVVPSHIGWKQNSLSLPKPWGFDLRAVEAEVLLMHGTDDPYASLEHARWFRRHIAAAELLEIEGGHFASWLQIRKQLAYLRERHASLTAGAEEAGKCAVSNTIHFSTDFNLSNCFENYV
jgi:pimeloyl-ACP methyl ester carboxylesterase